MIVPRTRGALALVERAEALPAGARLRRAVLVALALVLACALLSAAPAEAQCPERPDSLTLAILTWHEAGVDSLADAAAIHAALVSLAAVRGETWAEAACSYSRGALTGRTARAWISRLDASGAPPVGWPSGASWTVQGRLWDRLLDWCADVVGGWTPPACDFDPTDWGDPEHDSERIRRGVARGFWYRVDCGDARNVYLRRVAADREAP